MNKNRQIRKPGGEYLEVIAESNQIDGGSKERPLSAVSDEYVEIHDDIRSHASIEPLHTSPGESYDGYLKNPKEQGHRVTIQDNCAYNATVQIREETAISGRGRVIQSNSLYEEIPDRAAVESGISQATVSQPRVDAEGQKESKKIISPGEALWSFWQGKAEIAIRITNLAVSYTCITLYAFNYTHTHTHTAGGGNFSAAIRNHCKCGPYLRDQPRHRPECPLHTHPYLRHYCQLDAHADICRYNRSVPIHC